ncbi:hypothetical protein JXD38_07950 [candidate division WOR-3 bacterium]|nr:hypothetical protein [candidate division WOR-3 bacterium]
MSRRDRLLLGIIYEAEMPAFHSELLGSRNPVRDSLPRAELLERIARALAGS